MAFRLNVGEIFEVRANFTVFTLFILLRRGQQVEKALAEMVVGESMLAHRPLVEALQTRKISFS